MAVAKKTIARKPAKASPAEFNVEMELSKETKGTFVYASSEEDSAIPTLYIRKSAYPDGAPDSINVTVSVD